MSLSVTEYYSLSFFLECLFWPVDEYDLCSMISHSPKDTRINTERIISDVLCKNRDLLKQRPINCPNNLTCVTIGFTPLYFDIVSVELCLIVLRGSVAKGVSNDIVTLNIFELQVEEDSLLSVTGLVNVVN